VPQPTPPSRVPTIIIQFSGHLLTCRVNSTIIIVIITIIIITKVTPVIIGATGTISKSFRKYLSSVPGKHDIKELQKTAILGTAHMLREVLM
jgi:hypothetical protein